MTAIEMGIELDLVLQQVDSERFDTLEPEEADALLTNAMFQFIENRMSNISDIKRLGLQGSIKRTDELRTIIPDPILLSTYLDNSEDNKVYSIFPNKFYHHLRDTSIIIRNCAGISTHTTQMVTEYISVVSLDFNLNPFDDFMLVFDTTEIFNINDYPKVIERLNGMDAIFYLINIIKEELYLKNIDVYYEQYADIFHKNSLIFVRHDNTINTVTLNISTDYTKTYNFTPITRTRLVANTVDYSTSKRPNRLSKTEDIDNIAVDAILKTNYKSPVSTMENNLLKVYYDNTFIPSNVILSYIKRPRMISQLMDYNCELPERYHREIVLIAAQLAKAYMNAEDYQLLLKENLKME